MTTTGYEVHVIRDRRWVVAERFANDAREEAISAAKRMFNMDRVDGVRVFTEKFDNATQLFVPQYVMRDVRPGVKVARDAPVQAPAQPPARKITAPRTAAAQPLSANDWRPALAGPGPSPAFAGSIGGRGGFNPDLYLKSVAEGGSGGAPTAEQASVLREAGRRAFETMVLIAGLVMEGVGFAMLLALLDGSNATWNERPLWVGLAFGLLLGGLLIVVRQIGKLRKLGRWTRSRDDVLEPYPTPYAPREPRSANFQWRTLFDAVLFGKMPSKWPEPEADPQAPRPPESAAETPAAEPAPETMEESAPLNAEAEAAPIDQLTGFVRKYLHGPAFQEVVSGLMDEDSRFGAYLYLRGAAEACVAAAGVAPRLPGPVLTAALEPLGLSAGAIEDYALRRELFEQDPRYLSIVDLGRQAMGSALRRRQGDSAALTAAIAEWRQRPPLSESERLYLLTVEASLAMGGVPPEPSVVHHAFEDHKEMVATVAEIYRGRLLGGDGCVVFRAAPDAAAAAMEIQARRLELSMKEDAAPIDVRTVVAEYPLLRFESHNVGDILGGARGLTRSAIPGDVLVSESMRPALAGVGYALRGALTIPVPGRDPVQLAALEWSGAPMVSAAAPAAE